MGGEWWPVILIVVAVVVANGPALLHLVTVNPLVLDGGLGTSVTGHLPGLPYIDPNAGFTTQALGHLAALDWLHGHVPWWNPYEGVGSPLAGEMQSGAFFPPTLLLAVPQGMLALRIVLEVVAGLSTYGLVRTMGVGRAPSTTAAIAFALCGTFAWLFHAPFRPVAFLPLTLLGVEYALRSACDRRRGGWLVLAVALALSILAGFPETAFLDGLFAAWWALLRILGPARDSWFPAVRKLVAGAVTGAAVSAPLIVAFADYLPQADAGPHTGAIAYGSLPTAGLVQQILPYSLGPVFGFDSTGTGSNVIAGVWGNVGGYVTATLIAAALIGLFGRRWRSLRIGLAAWIALCVLRTYGFQPVVHALAPIPGIHSTAFYRYSAPSWALALIVLAALGIDDIGRAVTRRRVVAGSVAVTGGLCVWAAVVSWHQLTVAVGPTASSTAHRHLYAGVSLVVALALLAVIAVASFRTLALARVRRRRHAAGRPASLGRARWWRAVVGLAVIVEVVLAYGFTYLSAPAPQRLQTGSVGWLQAHLGTYRFVTLGPIQPNYGSYFGIAQASINDLPTPKAWAAYFASRLDTNAPSNVYIGSGRANPAGPSAAQEIERNQVSYEVAGIRYVVEGASGRDVQGIPFPSPNSPAWPAGPRLVYKDGVAEIWELPGAAPVFSVVAGTGAHRAAEAGGPGPGSHCGVAASGWDRATVTCSHTAVLVRRVQSMNGWSASVNGGSVPVSVDRRGPDGLFQQVRVPAGTSVVTFAYLPPYETVASLAALAGIAVMIVWFAFAVADRDRAGRVRGGGDRGGPEADGSAVDAADDGG